MIEVVKLVSLPVYLPVQLVVSFKETAPNPKSSKSFQMTILMLKPVVTWGYSPKRNLQLTPRTGPLWSEASASPATKLPDFTAVLSTQILYYWVNVTKSHSKWAKVWEWLEKNMMFVKNAEHGYDISWYNAYVYIYIHIYIYIYLSIYLYLSIYTTHKNPTPPWYGPKMSQICLNPR